MTRRGIVDVDVHPVPRDVDEIRRCPWHGWEFDLTTGRSVFNPHRPRVRRCDVSVGAAPDAADPSVETYALSVGDDLVLLRL